MRALLQRRCACGGTPGPDGECAACKAKRLRRQAGPPLAPPIVHDVLRSPGRPLEPTVRGEMEARFGHDFSRVRVHTDARAAESARAVGALAYTVGRDLVFGAGRYAPATLEGGRLLAHELAHVVQQRTRTSPRPMPSSVSGLDDPLEEEAERAAASVEDGGTAEVERRTGDEGTIYRVPLLPPGVDILAPLRAAVRLVSALVSSCDHPAALTWGEFRGSPRRGSRFSAETHFHHELFNASGQQVVRAVFEPDASWVRPRWANAGDRAQNGCAPEVQRCQQFFDREAQAGRTGGTFGPLGAPQGCAAAIAADPSMIATSRAECDSVYGAECDRVAQLESARLLRHEQGHYDLACVLARKGTMAILGGETPDVILGAVRRTSGTQTTLYDTQTAHGCNAGDQATWESDLEAGLPAVGIP